MDAKARLMIDIQKVNEEVVATQSKIEELTGAIAEIPSQMQKEKADKHAAAEKAFNSKRESRLKKVKAVVTAKIQAASDLVDSFPDMETKEFAGRVEIQSLEDRLRELYPASMVDNYICMSPVLFDDDAEAYQAYASAESMIVGLKQGNLSGNIFNLLTALLDKAADVPALGMKVVFVVLLFVVGGLLVSPFLFLTVFTFLEIISAVQGNHLSRIMRKLCSVKLYLNNAYDEDIFKRDRDDIMASVSQFLEEAEQEAVEAVESEKFSFDESEYAAIEKKYDLERQRLNSQLDVQNQTLQAKQSQLEKMLSDLEKLEEEEKKKAEYARKHFLGEITWQKVWPDNLFLDVVQGNHVKSLPFIRGNSLYYSTDIDSLKALSRLIVYQNMLGLHPEFASATVLDFKYNGGDLIQFVNVPTNILVLAYTEDDLQKQLEMISNDIRARTNNILGSCSSIEEFNALMQQYNTSGERYVIVHVFGLSSMTSSFLSNLRNGARVGYYFKFYWTVAEMQALKDDLPLEEFKEIYEVKDNPVARTPGVLRKLLGIGV